MAVLTGVLLAVTGCSRHDGASAATPQVPTSTQAPLHADPLRVEAQLLTQYPEIADRHGTTLTIYYERKPIITYNLDPKGCNPYSLSKVLRLYDVKSAHLESIAEVTCHFGYIDNHYLVLPTSDKFPIIDDVWASPDGKRLATGDNSMGPQPTRGHFTLFEWPSLKKIASFPAGCRVTGWQDSDHLTADCWHNDGSAPSDADDSRSVFFAAQVKRDDRGHWQMQATQWLEAETFKPIVLNKPLPHITAILPPPGQP